eukprot:1160436-Pelagomonas_calceolata.AAC.6
MTAPLQQAALSLHLSSWRFFDNLAAILVNQASPELLENPNCLQWKREGNRIMCARRHVHNSHPPQN